MSSYFRLLLLLSALTMVGPLAIDAYLPSFSAIRQDGNGHITVFIFQRQQLRWRLVDIQLPPGWAAADVPG